MCNFVSCEAGPKAAESWWGGKAGPRHVGTQQYGKGEIGEGDTAVASLWSVKRMNPPIFCAGDNCT